MGASLSIYQSYLESLSQIEVHQQGLYYRSSSDDLVGVVRRTAEDGFGPVGQKRNSRVIDTSLSKMVTRSWSQDTSLRTSQ